MVQSKMIDVLFTSIIESIILFFLVNFQRLTANVAI